MEIREVIQQSIFITSFIFMIMLLIEYVNVFSQGIWQYRLRKSRYGQYVFAALLGAIPGCLGVFTVVSLYSHGVVTIGALVTAAIATSGDEAFFMLATMPKMYLWITLILLAVGFIAGWLTDQLSSKKRTNQTDPCDGLEFHENEECVCFKHNNIVQQLKNCSLARGGLGAALVAIIFAFTTGIIGPQEWNWIRITLVASSFASLFIVITVPDHFLEEHLWNHVVKRHMPKIFLWTFGTLALLAFLQEFMDLQSWIQESGLLVLLLALLVGIIPESGPHLFFVTMYITGMLPMSVLLANSIVQDGHGMLPLLAHSRRDFLKVKGINLLVGLGTGLLGYYYGW